MIEEYFVKIETQKKKERKKITIITLKIENESETHKFNEMHPVK